MAASSRRRRVAGALYEPPPAPTPAPSAPPEPALPQLPPRSLWAIVGPLSPIVAFLGTLRYTHNALAATVVAVLLLLCVFAVGGRK